MTTRRPVALRPSNHSNRIERHVLRGARVLLRRPKGAPGRERRERPREARKGTAQPCAFGFDKLGQQEGAGDGDAEADFGKDPEAEPADVVGYVGVGAAHAVEVDDYHDGGDACAVSHDGLVFALKMDSGA